MGKYKVYYYEARGRAEIIRLILVANKQEFEDIRFTREEWPEYKHKSPTGQCPYVETPDGKILAHSLAIAKMIAQDHGMMGKNSHETYLIERMLDQINELEKEMTKLFFSLKPEEEKEMMKKEMMEGQGEVLTSMFDKYLDEQSGYVVKGRITLADFALMGMTDYLQILFTELYDKHPKLADHYDSVCKELPAVADWIKERPKTQY